MAQDKVISTSDFNTLHEGWIYQLDLEYADDTLLTAQSARQLQSMVQTLENIASKYGLKLCNPIGHTANNFLCIGNFDSGP